MKWNIHVRPEALVDIRAIGEFVRIEHEDEALASRIVTDIYNRIVALEDSPMRFRFHPLLEDINVRYAAVGSWVILFQTTEENKRVDVLCVTHRYRNVRDIMQ
ncbi:MAG: type II toxin-antitoxin system RelE/ParE family toxin [Actinomycetaceae bacterium]|nr:type II toxin-antitoxin system RelE/ParE family toxin [Actinomycetaceae bacterium]